ncbi:hypothetical protein [Paeniglutamicibacter terrestris]|uniref:Uncharacterized protein n=1 Tax=Paeniglutamicibacter terrestris TaxID=2723403 RepID=A0ABX1G7E9_9MICC|nr:hypothetical protein [Paeniglutamicibacter terrestris]NKG22198.1 hypothetical protein [Paeniglutamicibacter terrestris]
MATVTGNLKDIGGVAMANRNGIVKFTLNAGNITASGGGIRPENTQTVTPGSDGTFSTNLEPTVSMLRDAWYTVRIEWLDEEGNLIAYLDFQIRVPAGGGTLSELANLTGIGSGPGGGANPWIWWVGLTPPPARGYIWNYLDPADPDRETGPIPELTLGDIITRWW